MEGKLNGSLEEVRKEMKTLVQECRALLDVTADMGEQKIVEARTRLTSALETSRSILGEGENRTVLQCKKINRMVHAHPYEGIVLTFGLGTLLGGLLARR